MRDKTECQNVEEPKRKMEIIDMTVEDCTLTFHQKSATICGLAHYFVVHRRLILDTLLLM